MKNWILSATLLMVSHGIGAQEQEVAIFAQKDMIAGKKNSQTCPDMNFERGHEMNQPCVPAAYSEPAAFHAEKGYDIVAAASFLYWEAMQGGMDIAIPWQGTITTGALVDDQHPALGQSILMQDTEFKPGFQLELGWSGAKDNWVLSAKYTYLHASTHTSADAPQPDVTSVDGIAILADGIWVPTSWFTSSYYTNSFTTSISSKWKYKIDLVDAQISRPFYSGMRYSIEPFFGLRGGWIRQGMNMSAPTLDDGESVAKPLWTAQYTSRSSAVGPRIGVNGSWHLGYGIRFVGNAAGSLLFTNYDVAQTVSSPDAGDVRVKTRFDDLNLLRPNLDLSLGLGWGSYFSKKSLHWDLAATYDFSVFWSQNMMRALADLIADDDAWPSASPGDLYLQGLTVSTRFDF